MSLSESDSLIESLAKWSDCQEMPTYLKTTAVDAEHKTAKSRK